MSETRNVTESTFEIVTYRSSAEINRVDKTSYLTEVFTYKGYFRNEQNITSPIITIDVKGDNPVPEFNYVYIPLFNRYYFVTGYEVIRTDLWNVYLEVDVLMTYKNGIKSLRAIVDRNENTYNETIPDKNRTFRNGYNVSVENVSNNVFDTSGSFILQGTFLGVKEV